MSTLRTACAADPRPLSRLRESIVFQGIVRVKGGEKRKKLAIDSFEFSRFRSLLGGGNGGGNGGGIDSIARFSRKGKGDVRKGKVVIITIWKIFELIIK